MEKHVKSAKPVTVNVTQKDHLIIFGGANDIAPTMLQGRIFVVQYRNLWLKYSQFHQDEFNFKYYSST